MREIRTVYSLGRGIRKDRVLTAHAVAPVRRTGEKHGARRRGFNTCDVLNKGIVATISQ